MPTVLASLGLAVCIVLAIRMVLKPAWRRSFDATVMRSVHLLKAGVMTCRYHLFERRKASKMAKEAIRRARAQAASHSSPVHREGNVFKPEAFKGPKKPH